MRKNIVVFLIMLMWVSASAFGAETEPNRVTFQLQTEKWVLTDTAEVTVGISATLDKMGLSQARTQILEKLAILSKDADWHIIAFDRSQNQSGLEQLQAEAQARLPEKSLSDLRDKAKEISKPGLAFDIQNIVFVPSLADFEKARIDLRSMIYADAQAEVDKLNKAFPNQKYSVHSISFRDEGMPMPVINRPVYAAFVGGGAGAAVNKASAPEQSLTVSNKIQTTAMVTLDSAVDNTGH